MLWLTILNLPGTSFMFMHLIYVHFLVSCTWEGMVISRWWTGQFVQGRSCRLNEILSFTCIIASIEYIRRQVEESFTSCIKGLIRKFTEIHILTIQSGVNKRNKNRGEHSVIKHQFSIHSYIPVIKKYHGNQM